MISRRFGNRWLGGEVLHLLLRRDIGKAWICAGGEGGKGLSGTERNRREPGDNPRIASMLSGYRVDAFVDRTRQSNFFFPGFVVRGGGRKHGHDARG